MSDNRYSKATAGEKKVFTTLLALLTAFLTLGMVTVNHRELKGSKRIKYIFALNKNNPIIHGIEFRTVGEEIRSIVLIVSKVTIGSDFGKALLKTFKEAKGVYGNFAIVIPVETQEAVPGMLESIGKLVASSDELEMDPKRTYFDPPQGWLDGVDNAPPKKEKAPKKEKKTEKIEAAAAEAVTAPTAEEVAKEDIKSA